MRNKKRNEKKEEDKNKKPEKKHVFEVHTMHSDNEKKKNTAQIDNKLQASKPAPQKTEASIGTPIKKNAPSPQGAFAPQKDSGVDEKINYTPSDIALEKNKTVTGTPQKKSFSFVIIILIVLLVLGSGGFGLYLFLFSDGDQEMNNDVMVLENEAVDSSDDVVIDIDNIDPIDEYVDTDVTTPTEQVYSLELPNYFTINTESLTVATDIAGEFEKITQNIEKQEPSQPVSFIVTDANDNPVSFHIFATSAAMNIPQDILSSLEEGFEIYAYNDPEQGVRFGFTIEVKDSALLTEAIQKNELSLPDSLSIILDNQAIDTTKEVVFNDSVYNTHPIRYFNLNSEESYSVDYTITDMQLVLGTSKNTLRAMVDKIKSEVVL